MKMRRPRFVWLALTLLAGGLLAIVWSVLHGEAQKAHSDFDWFSRLGFPEVKGCPYVRVATGLWSQNGDDPPKNYYLNGFLLSSNATYFKIFAPDLSIGTYTNSGAAKPEHERVGFGLLDLRRAADLRLKQLRKPPAKEDHWIHFGARLSEEAEVFVLAWACWRQGLESEALGLYREASHLPRPVSGNTTGRGLLARLSALMQALQDQFQKMVSRKASFREKIEKSVAHSMMWKAVVDFEDPAISRPELLKEFEAILQNYPHSEHRERARKTAEVLRRMIAEDLAHAERGPNNLTRLPQEQVRELIFQLRDQNGQQISQPGWCDIFNDWTRQPNTAAHQLVNLGYAAVPQLIAALDSDTLTRSVGFHRDFYFSHTVLTVGDCAEQILQRISGRRLFIPSSTYSYMSKDGQGSPVRKAAEAWWNEAQEKGEQQMLVEGVAAGGDYAPAQAELLCRRYPAAACPALIQGTQAATNPWVRSQLVDQLGKIDSDAGTASLRRELVKGPELESRVAAAYALRPRDRQATIAAMIREWQDLATRTMDRDEEDGATRGVIQFLTGCDSVEAISALGHNLSQRPADVRLQVVEALGETNIFPFEHKAEIPSSATLGVTESLLVKALEDTEERLGLSGTRNDKRFSNPRICDMAACYLAERWPDRYAFDISGSLKNRERRRIECINAWRGAHHLTLMPMSQTRTVRVKRGDAVLVTSIEWATNSAVPGQAFGAAVSKLRDKPLTPQALVNLLASFVRNPEPTTRGLDLKATKDEDLTGVQIAVRLLPGMPPTQAEGWAVHESVGLGGKSIHSSNGAGTLGVYAEAEGWEDFSQAVRQAVTGSPETPFEIRARIVADRKH